MSSAKATHPYLKGALGVVAAGGTGALYDDLLTSWVNKGLYVVFFSPFSPNKSPLYRVERIANFSYSGLANKPLNSGKGVVTFSYSDLANNPLNRSEGVSDLANKPLNRGKKVVTFS